MTLTVHTKSCWVCTQAKVWEEYGQPFCDCGKAQMAADPGLPFIQWYNEQVNAGRNEREVAAVCKSFEPLPPLTYADEVTG